jgi:hypothetical protein
MTMTRIGFAPEEIDTAASTRSARLKWVVVVLDSLPPGRAANAAICVAAATSRSVDGLLGPDAVDADGSTHPGLPWIGCSVLSADAATLAAIRAKAESSEGVHVAAMSELAQSTRVYDEWLAGMAESGAADLQYYAVSVVGPKNRVDKIVGRLPLL